VNFCRVAVDSPVFALDRPFDYAVPDRLAGRVAVGSVVRVPLHGRRVRAYVTDLLEAPAVANARPLSALVSAGPLFAPPEIDLARWIARRYVTTLGAVLHDAVPGRYSAPVPARPRRAAAPQRPAWLGTELKGASTVCIVPASAQAELIAYAAANLRPALVICPRVDLAEALAERIAGAVVVHGDQRPAARAAAWAAAAAGEAAAVVGSRAALLVPIPKLRLVVVASAHDATLRSERTPRLHALVVARERAARADAAFLATSPAPPLDLLRGDVQVVEPRVAAGVRTELARPAPVPVTDRLLAVVRSATDAGRDALVFVARRGGALRATCEDCGWQARAAEARDACPRCGGRLSKRGWGHARVAAALERAGIDTPVVRLVRGDEVTPPASPVVVVGTLAAAHAWTRPFGSVAVADADQLLGRRDFRAAERALAVLNELAAVLSPGGRFLVQTREPEHHAVQAFVRRSFRFFADRELPLRREASYPPFGEVVVARVEPDDGDALAETMRGHGAIVLGPVDGRLLVRAPAVEPLLEPLREFVGTHARARVDVDPVDV
jgi:primosomal protein N' (replication factor Y)